MAPLAVVRAVRERAPAPSEAAVMTLEGEGSAAPRHVPAAESTLTGVLVEITIGLQGKTVTVDVQVAPPSVAVTTTWNTPGPNKPPEG